MADIGKINWSGLDRCSMLGRLLRLPLRAIPAGAVMTIRRGPALGMKWIAGSANHGCWLGTYELRKQRALERLVKPGTRVYDVGAQAGYYTLVLSGLVGSRGMVYAFEPCPYETRFLLDHVRLNNLRNVRVVQSAMSDHSGLSGFTTSRVQTQNSLSPAEDTIFLVTTTRLDDLAVPPPDLIKMDVEGAESAVLRGARNTLSRHRPVVFVALHGAEQLKQCFELLRQANYGIYNLEGKAMARETCEDEIIALPDSR
ncbi:MAG: FkbM family methyltransferase [Candidatus Binataceae bacterium]